MALENKNLTAVLYSIEGVGAVFVVIFLAAYLGGLPTTNVLQDQPAFRIPLTVLGALTLILIFVAIALAVRYRRQVAEAQGLSVTAASSFSCPIICLSPVSLNR
jgi:uncharacterized membrane protein (DUF4010 family)